jgi:hypothetical protein
VLSCVYDATSFVKVYLSTWTFHHIRSSQILLNSHEHHVCCQLGLGDFVAMDVMVLWLVNSLQNVRLLGYPCLLGTSHGPMEGGLGKVLCEYVGGKVVHGEEYTGSMSPSYYEGDLPIELYDEFVQHEHHFELLSPVTTAGATGAEAEVDEGEQAVDQQVAEGGRARAGCRGGNPGCSRRTS